MKQLGLGLNLSTKRRRKREFLDEMERVVPMVSELSLLLKDELEVYHELISVGIDR